MNELTVNATYTTQTVVTKQNVAAAVASGLLEVFSTPMLAALMEEAAYKLAQECLAEGQTTVGSRIDINHTAATPLGGVVRATATLTAVEGRKLCFRILAEAVEQDLAYELPCPVRLICGKQDRAGSCIRYNKAWQKDTKLPMAWLDKCGHNANTDRPEMVNRIIEDLAKSL